LINLIAPSGRAGLCLVYDDGLQFSARPCSIANRAARSCSLHWTLVITRRSQISRERRLLRTLAPDRARAGEHDFVLSSFPVFFCKDVVDYSMLMDAVSALRATWSEKFSRLARLIRFGVHYPRQSVMLLLTGVVSLATIRNSLAATYHSMSPYLFGDDKVVCCWA
jgi:hypothetical protein